MEKSIIEKLNLQKYTKKIILNQPKDLEALKELQNTDTEFTKTTYDLIFAFVYTIQELKELILLVDKQSYLNQSGYLFAAYPKKGNKTYKTFIHRDEIFPALEVNEEGVVGKTNLKFSRMVGMNEIFTVVGIKVNKKSSRSINTPSSQRTDDYIEQIPSLLAYMKGFPTQLEFYQNLPEGYQKDWVRHIYSAKKETTREKRRIEMIHILEMGFKSIALYQKR